MKKSSTIIGLAVIAIAATLACSQDLIAAEITAPAERIGVYDSRVIAYAHFWTDAHQRKLNEMVRAAKEAKASGDTNRLAELDEAIRREGQRNHLQVFSTASIDDLLSEMHEQVAAVQKETGVARLVSKWDQQSLAENRSAERVDVTDLLLRDFRLTDKQRKVVADIRSKQPLPINKAKKLLEQGKL